MRFDRICVFLIAMVILLNVTGFAQVETKGSVNLRMGPEIDYDVLASVPTGMMLEYCDQSETDARGVLWYRVRYGEQECWVSSKYALLNGNAAPQPTLSSDERIPQLLIDPFAVREYTELSAYYLAPLKESAAELELANYEEVPSEIPNRYSNEYLMLAGYDTVDSMLLTGGEYKLFGAVVGMHTHAVHALMRAAGLKLYSDDGDMVIYEHPSTEASFVDVNGVDSCINLYFTDGVLTELDWFSYTG